MFLPSADDIDVMSFFDDRKQVMFVGLAVVGFIVLNVGLAWFIFNVPDFLTGI